MTTNRSPHNAPTRAGRAVYLACCAVILVSTSLTASAQEQPQPSQGGKIPPQEANKPPEAPVAEERWNLFYQATSIGQYHGTFRSPYSGPFSLQDYMERDV